MAKPGTSSNLNISHQFISQSLRSSLQSLDNQQPPLESILHPTVFFGNIHSKQPRKSLYPKSQHHFNPSSTKQLISIQQAARDGRIDIVRSHIEKIGRDKKKLNKKDIENTTALHYAVRYNHMSIVKLLVENGANVNVQGEHGATPLHYASRYRKFYLKGPVTAPYDLPIANQLLSSRRRLKALRSLVGYGGRKKSAGLLGSGKRKSDDQGKGKVKNKFKMKKPQKRQFMRRIFGPLFAKGDSSGPNRDFVNEESVGSTATADFGPDIELSERKSLIEEMGMTDAGLCSNNPNTELSQMVPHITRERATPETQSSNREKDGGSNEDDDDDYNSFFGDVEKDDDSINSGPQVYRTRVQSVVSKDGFLDISLNSRPPVKSLSMPDIKALDSKSEKDDDEEKVLGPAQEKERAPSKERVPLARSGTFSSPHTIRFPVEHKLLDKALALDTIMTEGRSLDTLILKKINKPHKLVDDSIILYLLKNSADINARDYYGATPLHYAAQRGNLISVNELLTKKSIDIEAKDRTQMTALHCACSNGSLEVVEVLIEHNADLRCTDEENMRPLHFAAMEGHIHIVKLLFHAGEQTGGWHTLSRMILDEDRDGQTALHLAVENGHIDIVEICLENGANVNHYNTNLITPMHLAATSGKLEIAKVLVDHGANIEATNALQETPLHRAALFNRVNIVQYLLDIGAKIDCRDKDNETPLMMAVRKNNTDVVKLLAALGADVSLKDADDRTCLFIAAEEDCVETCKILLAQPNGHMLLDEFDDQENTPLHIAASKGYIKIVKLLLQHGALIDAKNDQNLTPLHLAAKYGRARIVDILLKRDISIVNDEDDASNTPLHLAALEGHSKVVQTLLTSGAAVDARNANMWTPLDCAASRGWTKCAEALLDGDSPIDPTDRGKTTPLHLSSKEGHVDMVKLLLANKADLSRKDHAGRNCLDIAIENNQKEAALAIVNDDNWKLALRNCTFEGMKATTPMRKLIKKLPEVAERVFYRCVVSNGLPPEHPNYEINCNYEFLEDNTTDLGQELAQARQNPYLGDAAKNVRKTNLMKNMRVPVADYAKQQFELKDNHPLMIMVQSQRTKLLSHPLVACLLRHKWQACGRYVYYSKLLVYAFYLIFLTGYSLYTVKNKYTISCTKSTNEIVKCSCVSNQELDTGAGRLWIDFGKWVVVIIACCSLFLEVIQMITLLHNYIRMHNIIEFSSYLISLIYILDAFTWNGQRIEIVKNGRCRFWHRSIGALAVWLSWLSLVLFMRKFPKLGIYVVMFTDILRTFAQFFVVFFLFIIAFGLGFHMLLFQQVPYAFATPGKAMLKTTMGMLGEIEYDNLFNENHPMPIAWGIYVMYLVINCIILMNLLVGLAVDDIKGVQENAVLKRYAMQVDLALDVEKALPLYLRRKLLQVEEVVQPNTVKSWRFWSFWGTTLKAPATVQQGPMEKLQVRQDELRMNVKSLKNKMKSLQTQNNRIETMLTAIIKHHKITVEYEVDDNDDEI